VGLYAQRARRKKCESMSWLWFNDPMKIMCFEHKTRMVDHIIKILIILIIFFPHKLWLLMKHFLTWVFYVWECTIFFSFTVICIHSNCSITSDVHLIICVFREKETIKRFSESKKEGYNILFSVFIVYFSFWLKINFDMCFDHLMKIYVSHDHYYSTTTW
jgi:hypothetical protein